MDDAEKAFDRWVTRPEWAKDAVVCDTTVTFSWRDRFRILFGRKPVVMTKTFTGAMVGRTETISHCYVPTIRPQRRGLVVEADAPRMDNTQGMTLEARLIHNAMTALRLPKRMPTLIRCDACRDLIDPCEACVAAWDAEGERRLDAWRNGDNERD